jgi:23S rRNA pseudouridine1911/1915/1917 synthase
MVSGNLCVDVGRRLQLSDVVKILAKPAAAPPKDNDVRVQYLDKHLIVVEKPAGVTSNRHREERDWPQRRKQIQPTLDELLPRVIDKIEGRGSRRGVPPPVRAVHRLDRDTSGLMVYARTREAERALSEQFRAHTTHRRYIAIVHGKVSSQTFRTRLIRDRGDGRRGSTKEPNVGKEAITHVKPLDFVEFAGSEAKTEGGRGRAEAANVGNNRGGYYTLIECRLETGRTHQIRIHLSEHGNPLCGEKVYLPKKNGKPMADNSGSPRLALHAAELGFEHPVSRKALRFQAALPLELTNFWRHLKQRGETNRR